MSTRTPTTWPEHGEPQGGGQRRKMLSGLRDARIRSKLSLLLVIPIVTVLSLAGLRLVDSGRRAVDADLVGALTTLSADVSGLNHELHRERMSAAEFLGDQKLGPEKYNQQAKRTDELVGRYTERRRGLPDVPDGVEERLRRIDEHLATLNGTRQEVLARQQGTSVGQVVLRYGVIITDLISYREEIAQVTSDDKLADELRAAAAFSKAKAHTAEQQAVGFAALKEGRLDDEQFSSFLATLTGQQEALLTFALTATPEQRVLVERTVTGDAVELVDRMTREVARSVGGPATVTPVEVSSAVGAVNDLMRWTEERLDASLTADAAALRAAVLRQVIIESSIVLITLLIAVIFALLLARSMARSLGRLREGALAVAHRDLPAAVARLRDVQGLGENSPDEIARQVRDPIALGTRDEIGQVGQAFNVVHREAVRIAAEQAALRTSVSAMFLNLARRSQTLVDRMIGELDHIERREEDPKRLAQLFQLDHLATRMRRNDENLLVLAGADSSPPRRDDALLVDALRAAQSEVELYDRIEFGTVDTDVSVAAHAVNDVVRLTAELLDNATRFSPPNTTVVADARRIGDYVLVQVEDHGLGLSDEQLHGLNERLGGPAGVDVAAFRMMGLAVVARLASRYDIRVELRRNAEGGTVANVALPASILVLPKIRGREPLVTRPRTPLAVETGPAWSARGPRQAVTDPPPVDWRTEDPTRNGPRPPVSVGMHVTGAAASSAAAAAGATMPIAGMQPNGPAPQPTFVATPAPVDIATAPQGYPIAAVPAAPPRADDTTELPIFREMEAAWFRTHGPITTDRWAPSVPPSVAPASAPPATGTMGYVPTTPHQQQYAGGYPTAPVSAVPASGIPASGIPASVSGIPAPVSAVPSPVSGIPSGPPVGIPRQREHDWRTAADDGWQAATAASAPRAGGTTRSGLPKRVPMGQLVPGGVDQAAAQSKAKRTPEEVRGLLSAYHRGVQRGRAGAPADLSKIATPDAFKGSS